MFNLIFDLIFVVLLANILLFLYYYRGNKLLFRNLESGVRWFGFKLVKLFVLQFNKMQNIIISGLYVRHVK